MYVVGVHGQFNDIIDKCYNYLESHLCEGTKWNLSYHFYRPSIEKYSADQWLWDSGAHMIVWSHRNVTNSILDLRTMLQFQQKDGRIPEEIFWSDRTPEEDAKILLQYSSTQFTDTTQMPVLPFSLRAIYEQSQDKQVLTEFLYPLIDYFNWWRVTRDVDGDGLVAAIHNWETGLDASPAYDPAFNVYITDVNKTSWSELYPKFIEVVESYHLLYQWNVTAILARKRAPLVPSKIDTWFVMKDIALNCVYAAGWEILSDLAHIIGHDDTAAKCKQEFQRTSSAIQSKMFNKKTQSFQSIYKDSRDGVNKFSIANTVQNLFPILLSDLSSTHLNAIVAQLTNTDQFKAPFSIPTVALNDPQFCPTFDADLMWRGPVWGFTNWFILEGLGLHKQLDVQADILTSWIKLIQKSGIYEHYNPFSGEPYGPEGLGMTTLVCDWIYRYGWDK